LANELKLTVQGIYKITNKINGKVYIGSSNKVNIRWNNHKSSLRNNRHANEHLQRSWNRYGEESFIFEIIEAVEDDSQLLIREQFYIDFYKSHDYIFGYNISTVAGRPINLNQLKGEDCNLSKLKESEIKLISEMLIDPNITQEEIANKFNVDPSTISAIKNNKSWKHVESDEKKLRRKKSPSAKSKYLGVYPRETKNGIRYAISIFPEGKKGNRLNFGTYSNEIAAANIYNYEIVKILGNSAVLNNVSYMTTKECREFKLENGKGTVRKRQNNSGFIGVYWQKNRNKWVVRVNDRQIATHENVIKAAKIYNRKVIELYGKDYEKLNRDEKGEILL